MQARATILAGFITYYLRLETDKERDEYKMRISNIFAMHNQSRDKQQIEEIVKMKSFTESIGSDFLVALVPIFPRSTNSFDKYPINDLHEDLSKNLSVNAIETVDLFNAFLDSGAPIDQVSRDIWHLNEMGHQTVGLEFYRLLLDGSGQ